MAELSFPQSYPVTNLLDSEKPASGQVFLWPTPDGWIEKRYDGSVHRVSPTMDGQSVDLNTIKVTSSGVCIGGNLVGAPSNAGQRVFACWSHTGDATTSEMALVVWAAPNYRPIEGSWLRSRKDGSWGEWVLAPKASDFQVTTGNRTVFTGESWTVGDAHLVNMNFLDVTKSIKLKPATDWTKVPQPTGNPFTVSAKPTSGNEVVEYKFNQGRGNWDIIPPVADPLVTRITAIETLNTAQNTRLDALEGKNYDLELFALDSGTLFVANEAIGIGFVHLRSDGKIEVATDAVHDKPANGFIRSPLASGASAKVYGSGSRVSDLGLTGVSANQRLYLGSGGDASLTTSGTNRLIQSVGIYRNNYYFLDFSDSGYWVV